MLNYPVLSAVRFSQTRAIARPGARVALPLAWGVLGVFLIVYVPLFVCMPVTTDVTFYDLCARNVLHGGVHYRDTFDTNLPGMVWLHMAVRSLVGWRSEAIRLVDLGLVAGVVWLLVRWWSPTGANRAFAVWLAALLSACYLGTSDLCHCQRDTWMLLPALAALYLRRRQITSRPGVDVSFLRTAAWAAIEGMCWGAAFWIKPFVAVPALMCWCLSLCLVGRYGGPSWRMLAMATAGVLGGGLLVGGLGVIWLLRTGAWPYCLDIFLNWNWEYRPDPSIRYLVGRTFLALLDRVWPWGLVHLLAVPAAIRILWRTLVWPGPRHHPAQALDPAAAVLLAGCYLGWLAQVIGLQKGFEYQQVPAILLALTLLAGACFLSARSRLLRVGVIGLAMLALLHHPVWQRSRTALWARCWREGSSLELRDRLDLTGDVNWQELQILAEYLQEHQVGDGDLTCLDARTMQLYAQLGINPSTRYLVFSGMYDVFASHREQFRRELFGSHHRYLVADLCEIPLTRAQVASPGPSREPVLPPAFPPPLRNHYPWTQPLIFRTGRYVVFRVRGSANVQTASGPQSSPSRVDSPGYATSR